MCEEKTDIANIAVSYFKELYFTSFPTSAMEVADLISRRITREMNEDLTKEFQKKEVIQAIRQMHPTKSQALTVCLLSFIKSIGISLGKM